MLTTRSMAGIFVAAVFGASVTVFASLGDFTRAIAVLFLLTLTLTGLIFRRPLSRAAAAAASLTWWQLLWLLAFLSGLVFRARTSQDIAANAVDGWAIFRIALMGVNAGILILRLALRRTLWLEYLQRGPIAALLVYCLVCLTSTLWSVFPAWTLYKSVEFSTDVILLAAVAATANSVEMWKKLLDWTWILSGALLFSVWLGILISPEPALHSNEGVLGFQLSGVLPDVDSNSVGELGAILGVISFCRLLSRSSRRTGRSWYGMLFAGCFLTMVLAQARSAVLGFTVAMALVLALSGRVRLISGLGVIGVLSFLIGPARDTFMAFMRRGETEDEIYKLSSRVDWWSFAWPRILEHPIIGYGAYAGARFLVMAEFKLDTGIHSDWLEILVGSGISGLIPALLAFFATWYQLLKSVHHPSLLDSERLLAMEAIGAFAVMSVRSVFSPVLYLHPPLVFLAAMGCAEFLRVRRLSRQDVMSPLLVGA